MDSRSEDKELLLAIVDGTDDLIYVKDLEGRYIFANSKTFQFFNKTFDQISGKSDFDLFPLEMATRLRVDDQRVTQSGKSLSYEEAIHSPDGGLMYTLTTKCPYRSQTGEIIGVLEIRRDITARKIAEEKLRSELAYRKPIEEAMLAGVVAVDLTGKLIYVNSAFCKMVGWPEQELLGKTPPFPYWVPEEIKNNMESVKSRINTGNTSEFKTLFRRKNGERFPVLIKTAPLADGYGKEIGFVATVSDITVQASTEDKLQESYNLLHSIMEGTTDAVYLRDLEGRYLMINSYGAKFFNKSQEEIVGKNLSDLFPPDFVQKTKETDQRTLTTGDTETVENKILINGIEHVFLTTRGPIRNFEKAIIGFFGISRDITERKMAENRLKSEFAFRKAIEHSLIAGVAAVDVSGRMIYVNPAFCRMTGWSETELLGSTPPFVYWPPEEVPNIMKLFKERLDKGISAEGEMILRRKTEERFPVMILRSPLKDADGNNLGLLASFYDLTERKRAEEALRQANQILERFINACPLSIMVFDSEGIVKMANPATELIFGWRKEELIGRFNPIVPDDKRNEFLSNIDSVIRGNSIIALEARRQKRSGDSIELNLWAVSFLDENGHPCVLSISADITEKRKMEEEILKIEKLQSLGVLAGGIAHDFNNILTGILGNISLAKTWLDPSDRAVARLIEAEKASQRATELARQLLTFARGGNPVKTVTAIQEVLESSVQFALRGSNIQGKLSFQEGLWPVEIDEGQITQVIQNLLINARQAMPEGGNIEIKARNVVIGEMNSEHQSLRKGNYLKISIQDEGVGIPKEYLPKIFDPYFTTKQKGSGLGLAISHSVIQRHNGFISVESKTGKGTTFFFYLPASPQAVVPQKKEEEPLEMGRGKVLIMDDEESVLDVAKEMLKELGYKVELAHGGAEAVAAYKKSIESGKPFDLVITDLTVPGDIGGIEVLRKIKNMNSQVKVIVSSGYSNDPAIAEYQAYGFSYFLMKPFEITELGKTLKKVLGDRRKKV